MRPSYGTRPQMAKGNARLTLPVKRSCIDSIAVIDYFMCMATLTIRNLNEDVKRKLRMRAASQGRSMEAEARCLLAQALTTGAQTDSEGAPPSIRGKWKGKFTTDQLLRLTRGED